MKFNNSYMRPNKKNQGEVPDYNGYAFSPDIWVNGSEPLDWKSFLTDKTNYSTESNYNLEFGKDNYIYVRCYNNTGKTQNNFVSLYYAPASTILNPQSWKNNKIYTDKNSDVSNINADDQQIGVVEDPFIWESVPFPPSEAGHYCIMAHMNDALNTNPFPDPKSYVDMAHILQNNLRWAQRNVTIVKPAQAATMSYNTDLMIDIDLIEEAGEFDIVLRPDSNFKDWEVEFFCSRPDSQGKPIALKRKKVDGETEVLGGHFKLEYGFNGKISVYAYNTSGRPPVPGQSIPLEISYKVHRSELEYARKLGVLNEKYSAMINEKIHGRTTNIEHYVVVGQYTGMVGK